MTDRDTTKQMFTHMINMMEQHDTMTISCGDPLMKLLKDVRELLNEQREIVRCKDCRNGVKSPTFRYYPKITWCNKHSTSHNDNWFCADGEQKTNCSDIPNS